MVKAVVFDLDDTLISEKEYIRSGYLHVAGIIEDRFAMDKKQVFDELMSLFNVSPLNVFNRLIIKECDALSLSHIYCDVSNNLSVSTDTNNNSRSDSFYHSRFLISFKLIILMSSFISLK